MTTCARNLPQHFNGCTCVADPSITAEATDVTLGDPAIPLAEAIPVGGTLTVGEDEFPGYDYAFESIDVSRNDDDTYAVQANAYTDVQYGLVAAIAKERGFDPDSLDSTDDVVDADREVNAWLERHSEDAIAWFENETGSTLGREFEWDHQQFSWSTEMAADASTDEIIDAADECSDTHPDEFDDFYPKMLREAEGFIKRRDAQG